MTLLHHNHRAKSRLSSHAFKPHALLKVLSWWQWLLVWIIGGGLALVGLWFSWDFQPLSPLNDQTTFRFLTGQEPPSTSGKVVYGFLPYWNLDEVSIQPEMTHLGYFSLGINANGEIRTRGPDGYLEPGYNQLGSDTWFEVMGQHEGPIELVFTQFDADDIATFVTSENYHQNFLDDLDSILLAYPVTGINIDIEYAGTYSDQVRDGLTQFMATLDDHLDQRYGKDAILLSIDMFASAGSRRTIWDVGPLAEHIDYMIVMAYDFHRRSSTVAGPVAPLFGGKELWDSDISEHLQGFLAKVPAEKILLGVPFYGYEWQTTSRDPQAHTFPDTGATASYKRVQEILAQQDTLQVEEQWNETALSPYVSYVEDGEIYVIYYEDSRSLSYKLDFVNQLNLGGIAIWALGYEGDSRELWEVVARKL